MYQREGLLDETFKDSAVCESLEDTGEDNAVLCIRGQYLISLLPLESGNLYRRHTMGRPSHPSITTPFVTARLIHENKVIRTETRIRQVMLAQVS